MNALAAIKLCEAFGIPLATAAATLAKLPVVRGRVEHIDAGQDFIVVVDYAHTPDSLQALYDAFQKIVKFASWATLAAGAIPGNVRRWAASRTKHVKKSFSPTKTRMTRTRAPSFSRWRAGMKRPPLIIMDRREAIRAALMAARTGDVILISGKGTDPFIMGAKGAKVPWSDAGVVREELGRLLAKV